MKYRLLLLFLLTSCAFVNAQRTFHAGISAGINGCQIHGDNAWGYHQSGFVGGIFVCTNPEKKWYGQMEMIFSMKGSRKYANPDKGDFNSFQFRLNYFEVPLLARYNTGKIYFEAGETFGVLINAKEWDANGVIPARDYRRWETAFVAGVGYNINDNWQIDFRTVNSLLPVYKFALPFNYNRFIPNLFNRGMYNNILSLTINYRFGKQPSE